MMPYFSDVALPSEPEGWDVAEILELENPVTKRWSCPTLTLRNRRCENVVSQDRSIKVKAMINDMAIEDAAVIVRDENCELTNLAKTMLCPSKHASSDEKIRGVVALWKNDIKTWMRSQARPPAVIYTPQAPATAYQPSMASSGLPRRRTNTPSERAATISDLEVRPRSMVFETSSSPTQSSTKPPPPPPSANRGASFDADTLKHLMSEFSRLNQEIQTLKDTNRRLRAENAQLLDKQKEMATEHRRTKGELRVVEDERNALSDQVDDQYQEINMLRAREDRRLERIAALEDSVQTSNRTYRGRKKLSSADSVVPKMKDEDD